MEVDKQIFLSAAGAEIAWMPQLRAKPGGSGEGNEAQTTHQKEFTAILILHVLFETAMCRTCNLRCDREAGYMCTGCLRAFHAQCL